MTADDEDAVASRGCVIEYLINLVIVVIIMFPVNWGLKAIWPRFINWPYGLPWILPVVIAYLVLLLGLFLVARVQRKSQVRG